MKKYFSLFLLISLLIFPLATGTSKTSDFGVATRSRGKLDFKSRSPYVLFTCQKEGFFEVRSLQTGKSVFCHDWVDYSHGPFLEDRKIVFYDPDKGAKSNIRMDFDGNVEYFDPTINQTNPPTRHKITQNTDKSYTLRVLSVDGDKEIWTMTTKSGEKIEYKDGWFLYSGSGFMKVLNPLIGEIALALEGKTVQFAGQNDDFGVFYVFDGPKDFVCQILDWKTLKLLVKTKIPLAVTPIFGNGEIVFVCRTDRRLPDVIKTESNWDWTRYTREKGIENFAFSVEGVFELAANEVIDAKGYLLSFATIDPQKLVIIDARIGKTVFERPFYPVVANFFGDVLYYQSWFDCGAVDTATWRTLWRFGFGGEAGEYDGYKYYVQNMVFGEKDDEPLLRFEIIDLKTGLLEPYEYLVPYNWSEIVFTKHGIATLPTEHSFSRGTRPGFALFAPGLAEPIYSLHKNLGGWVKHYEITDNGESLLLEMATPSTGETRRYKLVIADGSLELLK